ncbi:endonuclease NucS domain-containing protein [Burkholderia guangdongensis]|uniref:endonuclease NucS domain-containing protein n=1 Tax=Burkholderia guangdongensis TaxID=1792500 RepID=UPI0015CC0E86|nr:endonuclease NucS domain-containing protein [Burkholderia guangdongensis]
MDESTMSNGNFEAREGRPPLERDVQEFLADSLSESIGEPLTLIQTEYPVSFGRIDILAKDKLDRFVVIELKLGTASRDAVGQLQSYMGALVQENPESFVRGILVGSALDAGAQAALLVANDIQFVSFSIAFTFSHALASKNTYDEWIARKTKNAVTSKKNVVSSAPDKTTPAIWLPPGFRK